MIASILLLMIGSVDAVRRDDLHDPSGHRQRGSTRRRRRVSAVVLVLLVAVVSTLALGLEWYWAVMCAVATAAWTGLMPTSSSGDGAAEERPTPLWPAIALLVVLAIVVLVDRTTITVPRIVEQVLGTGARAAPYGITADTVLAAAAVALALTHTANLVVRAALGRRHGVTPDESTAPSTVPVSPVRVDPAGHSLVAAAAPLVRRASWTVRVRGRPLVTIHHEPGVHAAQHDGAPSARPIVSALSSPAATHDDRADAPTGTMRGGRHIGPVERILVTAAIVAGAFPIVAGLLAAKGIVRFPEISQDRSSGGKAEEFLVGSMSSWAIAGAASLYLVAVHGA